MPSEKELDLALASALERDPAFLAWLLGHTRFAGAGAMFHRCRSDHPWGTHPFVATDPDTGEITTTQRQSETDVLFVVAAADGRLLGIHIENKIGSGKFTDAQPEMYAQRAAHWNGNDRYGGYMDFDTVLLAPEAFRQRNAEQARRFGCFLSHEAVAAFVPLFRKDAGVF